MSKLKVIAKNRDAQSAFLALGIIAVLIIGHEAFKFGSYVAYSLVPISTINYYISYRSGWRGVIIAIITNVIMVFYVLSLTPSEFNLGRASLSIIGNAIGYSIIGWLSETLKNEKLRTNYLGQIQLARFRAAFEQAEGHILRVMTLIEMRKAVVEDEADFIIEQLKRAQSLLANQVTIAEVARQLVEDKEKLGLIDKDDKVDH